MSHDTVVHQLIRPVVRMAAGTGLTPNKITTMRLVTGLAASAIFAQGTYEWMVLGGVVFLFSLLLDRADGELARQTGQMSPSGHRYDLAADAIASVASFVGLGIGLAQTQGQSAFWIGVLAAAGIGILFFELNVMRVVPVGGHQLFGGRFIVDPDDAMIFVPVLIWCNLAGPMVMVAAVMTSCAALAVGALAFARRRANLAGRRQVRSGSACRIADHHPG